MPLLRDPALVFSCDPPLGWVLSPESSLFRMVLHHPQYPKQRIALAVEDSAAPPVASGGDWIVAARDRFRLDAQALPIELGGQAALEARWREDAVHRVRIVRRGAGLDLVVDHFADEADEGRRRELRRLVDGAGVPVAGARTRPEQVVAALAAVDQAASGPGDQFRRALIHAEEVLSDRWQASIAGGLAFADVEALEMLVVELVRHAGAGAEPRRLLRAHALLLRAVPPMVSDPDRSVAASIEQRVWERLGGTLRFFPASYQRMRAAHGRRPDPDFPGLGLEGRHMMLASYLLTHLKGELAAAEERDRPDHADALACAREIVDAMLSLCLALPRGADGEVPSELAYRVCEALVTFLDEALAADRTQDAEEAAVLLAGLAEVVRRGATGDESRRAAARHVLIATVARGTVRTRAGDEASLREALSLVERARGELANASGDTRPDLVNICHHQALAALQLGDLELARAAAREGLAAAEREPVIGFHVQFFRWAQEVAAALVGRGPGIRSIPGLKLIVHEAASDDEPAFLNGVCRGVQDALEENPISINALEALSLAGKSVDDPSPRAELEAAARAVLDIRRLVVDRNPELRIGADDSLLARDLAAGHVEEEMRRGNEAGALAVEHACSRSLVLDLAAEPAGVARIEAALARRYGDAVRAVVERTLREQMPAPFRLPPPWSFPRGPSWLRQRADKLREWCHDLTGVMGGQSLTAAELQQAVDDHGEPVLLLYPVGGRIGGFLLRPGAPVAVEPSTATAAQVLETASRLAANLGSGSSTRARDFGGQQDPGAGAASADACWDAAADLFRDLLAPFVGMLADARRLTIVPHRELAAIPFNLLPEEGRRPLAHRISLTMASSVAMLRELHKRTAPEPARRAFVVGDPETLEAGTIRLPEAAAEARALAERLRAADPPWEVVWPDERNATPGAYAAGAAGAGLVHLACHGAVGNVARDAALLLAPGESGRGGGRLTAADIGRVPLPGGLVFLSACRSGAGRPTADGTIGLARAFLAAGATAVVGSLWNVPDASTRLLVQHFYDAALSSADAADALRAAAVATRAALAKRDGVSVDDVHPGAWGAFFLLGRGALRL